MRRSTSKKEDVQVYDPTQWKAGDLVWCKMKGSNWWPAKVESKESLPIDIKFTRAHADEIPIYFFGSHNFVWIAPTVDTIKSYSDKNVSMKGTKLFMNGLKEIEDPASWPSVDDFELSAEVLDDFVDEEMKLIDPNVLLN